MANASLGAAPDVLLPVATGAVLLVVVVGFFNIESAGGAIVDVREAAVEGTTGGAIDGRGRRLLDIEGAIVA